MVARAAHSDDAEPTVAQARAAFAELAEGDRGWCQASLDKLTTQTPG